MCPDLQILKYDTLKLVIVYKLLSKWLFKDGLTLLSSAPLEKNLRINGRQILCMWTTISTV